MFARANIVELTVSKQVIPGMPDWLTGLIIIIVVIVITTLLVR